MARSKAETSLSLTIPEQLHKQIQVQAEACGTTTEDLIIEAIEDYLDDYELQGGVAELPKRA